MGLFYVPDNNSPFNNPLSGAQQISIPPGMSSREMKKMFRVFQEMTNPKKDDKKEQDKKKSLLTTLQWAIILCTFGPLMVPWYSWAVAASWQFAMGALRALYH